MYFYVAYRLEVSIIKTKLLSLFLVLTLLAFPQLSCTSSEEDSETDVSPSHVTESAPDTEYEALEPLETVPAATSVDIDYRKGFHSFYQANFATMDIENIMQMEIGMPNCCEAVSLSMALSYYGFHIDPRFLYEAFMPHGEYGKVNPFDAYMGNPKNGTGFGCYAPCIVETANKFLERKGSKRRAHDISGSSMYDILGYIWNGTPVILWGTLDMKKSRVLDSWYFNDQRVYWYELSHCVLITGVKKDSFIVCDPMVGKVEYKISQVEEAYSQIYSQAVAIW